MTFGLSRNGEEVLTPLTKLCVKVFEENLVSIEESFDS